MALRVAVFSLLLLLGASSAWAQRTFRVNGRTYRSDKAHLGIGGYGTVYAARSQHTTARGHLRDGKQVVIKTIGDRQLGDTAGGRLAYRHELGVLRALQGIEGVPVLVDHGKSEDGYHIVTRWQRAKSGDSWVAGVFGRQREAHMFRGAPNIKPDTRRLVRVVRKTAGIIDRIHQRGYANLDVKPHNILVDARDRVTVIDFGTAARIGSRVMPQLGRPFTAPEQYLPHRADRTTDVFRLGLTLFYAVTNGGLMYDKAQSSVRPGRIREVRRMYQERENLWLVSDPGLKAILHKALDPKPKNRYQNMRQFMAALDAWERSAAD